MVWDGGALCVQGRLSCGEVHGKVLARVTDPEFAVAAAQAAFGHFLDAAESAVTVYVCACV